MVKDMHKEQKRLHRTLRSHVNLAKTKLIDIYLCCYKVCLPVSLTYFCEMLGSKRVKEPVWQTGKVYIMRLGPEEAEYTGRTCNQDN